MTTGEPTGIQTSTDWLGNTFSVGDPVVYCITAGRSQLMAIGVVQAIRATPKTHWTGRRAEPGETPTRILFWHDPPTPWIDYEEPITDITVQVLTHCTSGRWDSEKRTRPAWVNPLNITAITGLKQAADARVNPAGQ